MPVIQFVIENIGGRYINDIWFGINMDADIYSEYGPYSGNGWADDASGVLDTFLYDDDAGSRVVIPYSFDMDGDPGLAGDWETTSVRGMVSIALLAFPDANPECNFNWWIANTNPEIDFGPRRVGTAEDPFRTFAGDFLGSAHRQEDKYYQMARVTEPYGQIYLLQPTFIQSF